MGNRLTDSLVRKTKPPKTRQCFLWDTEVKGFALRVTPGGAKSFVLDYRVDGRQRRMTIGRYPDWSVAAARSEARDLKRARDRGDDPMGERHFDREAQTLRDLWHRYRDDHLSLKSARSRLDQTSMWEKIILPVLGAHRLESIQH